MSSYGLIGDLLVRSGVVDAITFERAIEDQATNGRSLGKTLAILGVADEVQVASAIASGLRLDYYNGDLPVAAEVARDLLTVDFCRKNRTLPLGMDGNRLKLALADPMDYAVIQDVEFRTGKKVTPVIVTESWIQRGTDRLYLPQTEAQKTYDMLDAARPAGEVEASQITEYDLVDPDELTKDTGLPPIVKLVNLILTEAAKSSASDVHVEPNESFVQVRQRVDGLLREVLTIPRHLQDQTTSRFKIISGMDIAERRKPQDGRCRLRYDGRRIDLRVSTLPTQFGEKVVIRFLTNESIRTIGDLALTPDNRRMVESFLSRPQGLMLVTGPTGSGKTSTLYAILNFIKSSANNIITLEDPIEFQVAGVNQVQINPRAGVTFATGLRSMLRQDPNIIFVGEIRDQETANMALEAAQTGHLMLSTLHTNDGPSTITRLIDLGVQPFLIASSLVGVVAQRLVRRPCPACAMPEAPSAEVVEKLEPFAALPKSDKWMAAKGCDACGHSGYRGRIAIHEILSVTEEIRQLVASRSPEHAIRKTARRAGMRTLLEDGVEKASQGLTTLEDVFRVVSLDQSRAVALEPAVASERSVGAKGASHSFVGRKVLVVDDSATIGTVVKYFLELDGFEVTVAEDGTAGLERARLDKPDLIVADIVMPGGSGFQMVKALRQDPGTAGIKVLMLTSDTSVESEAESLAAGADDHIVKPVEPRRLAARVKALLSR